MAITCFCFRSTFKEGSVGFSVPPQGTLGLMKWRFNCMAFSCLDLGNTGPHLTELCWLWVWIHFLGDLRLRHLLLCRWGFAYKSSWGIMLRPPPFRASGQPTPGRQSRFPIGINYFSLRGNWAYNVIKNDVWKALNTSCRQPCNGLVKALWRNLYKAFKRFLKGLPKALEDFWKTFWRTSNSI